MSSPTYDAVVLYFALNGTDEPISCRSIPSEENLDYCGQVPVVAISHDDGSPLCAECARSADEDAHYLSAEVLAEIVRTRETLTSIQARRTGGAV